MTNEDITNLLTQMKPVIREAVQEAIPDRIITVSEACRILDLRNRYSTVLDLIKKGVLKNYGTGKQRPKLSYNEVARYKIDGAKMLSIAVQDPVSFSHGACTNQLDEYDILRIKTLAKDAKCFVEVTEVKRIE